MKLDFEVKHQDCKLLGNNELVAGCRNYVYAHFAFTDDWDGLTKMVFFKQPESTFITLVLDRNDCCLVPGEVLADDGEFTVHLVGSSNVAGVTITTNPLRLFVKGNDIITNDNTGTPTVDFLVESVTTVKQYRDEAEEISLVVQKNAEAAATSEKSAAESAEKTAKFTESAAASEKNAAESAEEATRQAESAAASVVDAAESAEEATRQAEMAAVSAKAAENSAKYAEEVTLGVGAGLSKAVFSVNGILPDPSGNVNLFCAGAGGNCGDGGACCSGLTFTTYGAARNRPVGKPTYGFVTEDDEVLTLLFDGVLGSNGTMVIEGTYPYNIKILGDSQV